MTSIYQKVLGSDFSRLHSQIQRRFGFNAESGTASVGTGVMDEIWHGAAYTLPFLHIGAWRRIMFPEQGRNIPFRIENYAYRDALGRDTVTWVRTFETSRKRRFDAYMIYSEERGRVIDYLGTHQHLAVDIELSVEENGGLRFPAGPVGCRRCMRVVRRRESMFSHSGERDEQTVGSAVWLHRQLSGGLEADGCSHCSQ